MQYLRKHGVGVGVLPRLGIFASRSQGAGRQREGTRRMEIRKLPLFRPTTSNRAKFSAPPPVEARTGLPPKSSAISGARFRASSAIFAGVPRTRTVSSRCSPGFNGEESASRSSPTKVTENAADGCFAQETCTSAVSGRNSGGGRTTRAVGEEASTIAGCPAIVTWLASASPQKLFPKISKRSVNEATLGAKETSIESDAASPGNRIVVATRPVRPAIDPKITPGFSGATKRARPVASVVNQSPFEKFTVTPGVKRPFTSSTASVARSPETIRLGSSTIRAPKAAGVDC